MLMLKYSGFKYHGEVVIWTNEDLNKFGYAGIGYRPVELPFTTAKEAAKEARRHIKRAITKIEGPNSITRFQLDMGQIIT